MLKEYMIDGARIAVAIGSVLLLVQLLASKLG